MQAFAASPMTPGAALPAGQAKELSVRLLVLAMAGTVVALAGIWINNSEALTLLGCFAGLIVLTAFRLDYLHPAVAYLVPWLTILGFSDLPLSDYARPLAMSTCQFLLATIFVWLLMTVTPPVSPWRESAAIQLQPDAVNSGRLRVGIISGFVVFFVFAVFNVVWAGYVPLISLISTGDSGYGDFGIPSVYGAYLAYANAIACLAFYAYLRERRRIYLFLYLSVLVTHLLFVSRQNMITLLLEAFVLRCLLVKRASRLTLVGIASLGLVAFSALGQLRSGDVGELIRVNPQLDWLPNSVLWLYAYSYFNVLNLENMMTQSGAPFYDGSMWENLLPSILRNNVDHGDFLELQALNVSSYVYPIYLDIGALGVIVVTAFWGWVTAGAYRRALRYRRFVDTATYACLFGCALLSFFVDFWFYLPVIFQIVFFRMFNFLLFGSRRAADSASADVPAISAGGA